MLNEPSILIIMLSHNWRGLLASPVLPHGGVDGWPPASAAADAAPCGQFASGSSRPQALAAPSGPRLAHGGGGGRPPLQDVCPVGPFDHARIVPGLWLRAVSRRTVLRRMRFHSGIRQGPLIGLNGRSLGRKLYSISVSVDDGGDFVHRSPSWIEGSCRLLEMKIFELPGWFKRRRRHLDVAFPLGALPVMEMLSPAVPWSRSHLLRCCSSLRLHLGSTQCGYYVTGASSYGQSALAERFCHQLFLSKERWRIGAAWGLFKFEARTWKKIEARLVFSLFGVSRLVFSLLFGVSLCETWSLMTCIV